MKTRSISIVAAILIFALIATPVFAAKPAPLPRIIDTVADTENPAIHEAAVLVTGNGTEIGKVYIDSYENNAYEVRYEITEPEWYLTEVHFEAINDGDEAFVENKGTLIPGTFTVKEKFELTDEKTEYSFLYTSGAEVSEFAAHGIVGQQEVMLETYETVWGAGVDADTSNWSMIIENPDPICVTADFIAASIMFPDTAYDNTESQAHEDAEGIVTICDGEMHITASGLYPDTTYRVYFVPDGIIQGDLSSIGSGLFDDGEFESDSYGNGTFHYEFDLEPGEYTYSIWLNITEGAHYTVLMSQNLTFIID